MTYTLSHRLAGLEAAIAVARPHLDQADVEGAALIAERVRGRLRHGTAHTVVALAGPTGAGKSLLFNRLAGEELVKTGVRRPTTEQPHAAVWGPDASSLLDWLEIGPRHNVAGGDSSERAGLVLIDLPDYDSVVTSHRLEVERMLELADLVIWVVDHQKYADEALHDRYLRPLRHHHEVMRFVLNRSDELAAEEVAACVADFDRLVAADGIPAPGVRPISALTGAGVDLVSRELAAVVQERAATTRRLDADLGVAADLLRPAGPPAVDPGPAAVAELVDGLERAVGIAEIGDAVAAQHRHDAAIVAGWPPTAWVRRRRRGPVSMLPSVRRDATAGAEVDLALRAFGETVGGVVEPPWSVAVRDEILASRDDVLHRLGTIRLDATGHSSRPRWWSAVGGLQRLALLAAVVGLGWLIVVALVESLLQLDIDIATPDVWDGMPLPTLLLLAGAAAGLLLTIGSRWPAAIGGRRRARRTSKRLHRSVGQIADDVVVARAAAVLAERDELTRLVTIAADR